MNGPAITTIPVNGTVRKAALAGAPAPLPASPGAILSAAVDVGSVVQQVLNYGEPAAGARLVQGAVAGVVSVVHVAHSVLQAVEDHFLKTHTRGEAGSVPAFVTAQGRLDHAFAPVTLTSKNIHPHRQACARAHTHSQNVSQFRT